MKRVRIVSFIIATILLISLFSGCGAKESAGANDSQGQDSRQEPSQDTKVSADKKENSGKKLRIGFSLATLQEERWANDRDIFVGKCKELGADVVVQAASGDEKLQMSQCENLITQKVDALVVCPQNGETASAIVEMARKAGIPVLAYDRLIRNCDLDLYVTFDNVKIGELQAEYLVKKVPKGNYVLVGGAQTDYCAILVREGQMKVLKPYIDKGDIKVVADQWAKDWNPLEALKIVENALTKNNNDIQAVVTSNDGTAGGAIQALIEQKMAGKVAVSGQDADLAGCQRIVEGTQTMTVYVPIRLEATAAAECAVKLAKGEKPETNGKINNGKIDVPTVLLTPIAVDKDNILDTVIKDGYQKLEEVYKNVPKDKWPVQK